MTSQFTPQLTAFPPPLLGRPSPPENWGEYGTNNECFFSPNMLGTYPGNK